MLGPPGVGLLESEAFLTPAVTSELIRDIQRWTLIHALQQLARWNNTRSSERPLSMTVPILPRYVTTPTMPTDVISAINESGVTPSNLILQIHDSAFQDEMIGQPHLQALRDHGVRIAVQNPGTAGPTLSRLDHLPIDLLITSPDSSTAAEPHKNRLLKVLVHAAHTFNLPVAITGITHAAQLDLLQEMHCEYGQGPHIGEPVTELHPEHYRRTNPDASPLT